MFFPHKTGFTGKEKKQMKSTRFKSCIFYRKWSLQLCLSLTGFVAVLLINVFYHIFSTEIQCAALSSVNQATSVTIHPSEPPDTCLGNPQSVDTVCKVTCNPGYEFTTEYTTCKWTDENTKTAATWEGTLGCQKINCPAPPTSVPNSESVVEDSGDNCLDGAEKAVGTACTINCKSGYYAAAEKRTCRWTDNSMTAAAWHTAGTFECLEITCPAISNTAARGTFKITGHTVDGDVDPVLNCNDDLPKPWGTICKFDCNDGHYEGAGSDGSANTGAVVTCITDPDDATQGKWNVADPNVDDPERLSCAPVICEGISHNDHHAKSFEHAEGRTCIDVQSLDYGTVCTMKCKDGYKIDAIVPFRPDERVTSGEVKCVVDESTSIYGIWEAQGGDIEVEALTCTEVQCPAFTDTVNYGQFKITSVSGKGDACNDDSTKDYGTVCALICDIGYKATSSNVKTTNGELTCDVDPDTPEEGKWSIDGGVAAIGSLYCDICQYVYMLTPSEMAFQDAQKFCVNVGGTLAVHYITSEIATKAGLSTGSRYWIGFYDDEMTIGMNAVDGSDKMPDYGNGEPDQSGDHPCAIIKGYYWDAATYPCSNALMGICEICA